MTEPKGEPMARRLRRKKRLSQWAMTVGVGIGLTLLHVPGPVTADQGLTIARPAQVQERIDRAVAQLPADYRPRTVHLRANGKPKYSNRLLLESSPYLQQHAHNPVDWYPWGEEAFAQARRLGRPIFLSIGYSTCHWCHVMERESFEDEAIAQYLNANYIAIKVDREERPAVDSVYMTGLQILTGAGGWPLSSFLTPTGQAFHAGTYFPPAEFLQQLQQVVAAWQSGRVALEQRAAQLAVAISGDQQAAQQGRLEPEFIALVASQLLAAVDHEFGGLGSQPKFPRPNDWLFLLDQGQRGEVEVEPALRAALLAMGQGGIHDQIGGGFHRYAVDRRWQIPHFEKMLYSQAQLAQLYTRAYRALAEPYFARVAQLTLDYVLREMQAPGGGFFAATDADSAEGEGHYFRWTAAQFQQALGPDDAALALSAFALTGSVEADGGGVLQLRQSQLPDGDWARLDAIRARLYQARQTRQAPLRDDKQITAWNALLISALLEAAEGFDRPEYASAAEAAAQFLWRTNRDRDGLILRSSLHGAPGPAGVLEDYALFAQACVALHDATGDALWLGRAEQLVAQLHSRFGAARGGGYFMSQASELLPNRMMSARDDGSGPSGNAAALRVLSALYRRTGTLAYRQHAESLLARFAADVRAQPAAHGAFLHAAQEFSGGEIGTRQYAARGKLRLDARRDDLALRVQLQIAPGWHVNGHVPTLPNLIGTVLAGSGVQDIEYPEAAMQALGFADQPLAVYAGSIEISARLPDRAPVVLQLRLQACSDRICLPPETLNLHLPPANRLPAVPPLR